MDIPKVGEILYLLIWKNDHDIVIEPYEIGFTAKLSNGPYSWEIYLKSSYNFSRGITQLGKTMFRTKEEAENRRDEIYKERPF